MKRRTRIVLYSGLAVLVLAAAVAISALLIFRSAWFHDAVRNRIVTEVERATGGRAEIGAFQFDWRTLTATVKPFVLHGKERPQQPALFQAGPGPTGDRCRNPGIGVQREVRTMLFGRPQRDHY